MEPDRARTGRQDLPLHFIQNITVKLNGKRGDRGRGEPGGVAQPGVHRSALKGGAKGDKIEVSWLDNKGESNKTETAVA